MMMLQIPAKLPATNLPIHYHASQSSWIILILEDIIQFIKENPIINFVFQLELSFFGKMLKSTKIALPADPCQLPAISPSNTPTCLPIIMTNSRKKVYYSVIQGESDSQLCFSIGVMVLWQSAKKHQNCRSLPIARHQSSNPPICLPVMMDSSNIGVYYSVYQRESDYQLCFSIGVMILWQSAKKHQNCVAGDACRSLPIAATSPSNPPTCLPIIMIKSRKIIYYPVFQGEFEYPLCFSIGVLFLW
jgi:hypothetical protein